MGMLLNCCSRALALYRVEVLLLLLSLIITPVQGLQQVLSARTSSELHEALREVVQSRRIEAARVMTRQAPPDAEGIHFIVQLESSLYELDEPLLVELGEEFMPSGHSVTFRVEKQDATARCRNTGTAFVLRGTFGVGQWKVLPKGSLLITNCWNTSMIIETAPEPDVQNLNQLGATVEVAPMAVLDGFTFRNNSGILGGALRSSRAVLNIYNSAFLNNFAHAGGGAVYLESLSSMNLLVNSSFFHNRAPADGPDDRGGAIHLREMTCFRHAVNCSFVNNTGSRGGALHIGYALEDCGRRPFHPDNITMVMRNDTALLVAPYAKIPPEGELINTRKISSDVVGGPVVGDCPVGFSQECEEQSSRPEGEARKGFQMGLHRCLFQDNSAYLDGGALFVRTVSGAALSFHYSNVNFFNCIIRRNVAMSRGGVAFITGQINMGVQVIHSEVLHNKAGWAAGAFWVNSSNFAQVHLNGSAFMYNQVMPTVVLNENTPPSTDLGCGGVIVATGSYFMLHVNPDTLMAHNTVPHSGGAIYCFGCAFLTVTRARFVNNSAGISGGAIFSALHYGMAPLNDSVFDSNYVIGQSLKSIPPGVLFLPCGGGGGGAVCIQPLSQWMTLQNVTFVNNSGWYGGGLYLETQECWRRRKDSRYCTVFFLNATRFIRNTALLEGAAVYVTDMREQDKLLGCLPTSKASPQCLIDMAHNSIQRQGGQHVNVGAQPVRLKLDLPGGPVVKNDQKFGLRVTFLDPLNQTVFVESMEVRVALIGPEQETYLAYGSVNNTAGLNFTDLATYVSLREHVLATTGVMFADAIVHGETAMTIRGCVVGEVAATDRLCSSCNNPIAQTYSFNPKNGTCDRCPSYAQCNDGVTLLPSPYEHVGMESERETSPLGRWHSHPRSPQVHVCPLRHSCNGNITRMRELQQELVEGMGSYPLEATGAVMDGDLSTIPSTSSVMGTVEAYLQAQCGQGYTGILCGTCKTGWGRRRQACSQCRSPAVVWVIFWAFVLFDIIFLSILFLLRFRTYKGKPRTPSVSEDTNPLYGHSASQGAQPPVECLEASHMTVVVPPCVQENRDPIPMRSPRVTGRHEDPKTREMMKEQALDDLVGKVSEAAPGESAQKHVQQDDIKDNSKPSLASNFKKPPPMSNRPLQSPFNAHRKALRALVHPTVASTLAAPILEIVVIYVQVMGTMTRIRTSWPPIMVGFLSYMNFSSTKLNWFSVDCLLPDKSPFQRALGRIMVNAFMPVGVIFFFFALYLMRMVVRFKPRPRPAPQGPTRTAGRLLQRGVVPLLAITARVLLYYYSTMATTLLSLFSCIEVDVLDARTPYRGYLAASGRYWTQEYSEKCFQGRHLNLIWALGLPGLLLLAVGLPLVILAFLICHRRHLADAKFTYRFGTLYENYRPRYYFWFITNFILLLLLALVAESMHSFGGSLQLVVYMAVITLFLTLHLSYFPYEEALLNGLYALVMYGALVTAYLALSFGSDAVGATADRVMLWVIVSVGVLVTGVLLVHLIAAGLGFGLALKSGVHHLKLKQLLKFTTPRGKRATAVHEGKAFVEKS